MLQLPEEAVRNLAVLLLKIDDVRRDALEEFDAGAKRLEEALLLGADGLLDVGLLPRQLVERPAHLLLQRLDERVQKRLAEAERLVPVAHGAAQDSADDVATAHVARHHAVGDGEGDGANVVGDDAEGDAHPLPLLGVVGVHVVVAADGVAGRGIGHGLQERGEEVGVVRRAHALQDRHDALKAHARVHVLIGQRLEAAVRLRVVLDEDQVPDLHHLRVVLVDQVAPRHRVALSLRTQVDVHLRARAARPRVAHHPEVLLRRFVQNLLFRNGRLVEPPLVRLLVGVQSQFVVARVHRCVHPVRLQPPPIHQELPGPADGLGLEVVAEAPVAEHLEEGVVVRVVPHLLQVVVLAGHAEALLRVDGAVVRALSGAEKDVLELVHPGVREEQGTVALRHEGRTRDDLVGFLLKEAQELFADLLGGALNVGRSLEMSLHAGRIVRCSCG